MRIKSIKKRWLTSSLCITFIAFLLILLVFFISVKKYYYNLTEQTFTIVLVLFGSAIILLVSIINLHFIQYLIKPLNEISKAAQKIAEGNFGYKIKKHYHNEIGELCDNINNMSEKLMTSEKMKNEFISSISHELRTPLTAIKGWAETMKLSNNLDNFTLNKGLGIIVNETERLASIVEELLDFSRIKDKSMVLMLDKIDILAELDEAVYMYKDKALSEGKYLVLEMPQEVLAIVGDRNRLRQVFINVIDNSLKYTNKGDVINISVKIDDAFIHIIINDNGCGISSKDLPRIKDKFYKANKTKRGSGIGLAVANEIINLHSGKLKIESEENVGTTVIISLPTIESNIKE